MISKKTGSRPMRYDSAILHSYILDRSSIVISFKLIDWFRKSSVKVNSLTSKPYTQVALHRVQCRVWSAHYKVCSLQTVQCAVYSVQCTVYSVQCTVYSVQCTVYSVQCTEYSVHYAVLWSPVPASRVPQLPPTLATGTGTGRKQEQWPGTDKGRIQEQLPGNIHY